VTRLPLFSLATSQVSALRLLSPTSLPINPLLEDRCLQPGTAPSGLLGGKSRYCAFDDDCAGSDLSDTLPLDRFAKTSQRHEQIALALAGTDSRCHLPYQDYVPCPGSGPGSPAVSIATDYIPPAAPVFVEQSRPDLPPSMTLAGITSAPPPVSVNSPLTRYLEDTSQTHEWLAVVLEQDATLDSGPADAQETTPTRQDTPTSSITLDGDGSMFGGFHLAMPAEGLTSSTTRRREDGDEEEYTTEDNAKTLQALSHMYVLFKFLAPSLTYLHLLTPSTKQTSTT